MWGPSVFQPLSAQPQPDWLVSASPFCRTISAELVDAICIVALPVEVTESLNCTWTESFLMLLP